MFPIHPSSEQAGGSVGGDGEVTAREQDGEQSVQLIENSSHEESDRLK